MKVGITKINGKFNKDGSVISGEAYALTKLLAYSDFEEVRILGDAVNVNFQKTEVYPCELEYAKDLDVLFVVNGSLDFVGGIEKQEILKPFYLMNKFEGPVIYILTDPLLALYEVWKSIENKPWGSKYRKEDYVIRRHDIYCMHQCFTWDFIVERFGRRKGFFNEFTKTMHFPFYYYPFLLHSDKNGNIQYRNYPFERREFDLIYGGNLRDRKRQKKINEYLFGKINERLNVLFFGIRRKKALEKLKFKQPWPNIGKRIPYSQVVDFVGTKGKFTIIIGDDFKGKNWTQRIAESLIAGLVCIVDKDFDPDKKIFGDYVVNNQDELIEAIEKINKEGSWYEILREQREKFKVEPFAYAKEFSYAVKKLLNIKSTWRPRQLTKDEIILVNTFNFNDVEDWNRIRINTKNYVILKKEPSLSWLRFPGLVFDSKTKDFINKYYEVFIENEYHEVFTPPRGNLTSTLKYVFCGIKPGSYRIENSKAESAWLFGPSSRYLMDFCIQLKVFPYFTNVYKNFYDEENKDLTKIRKELKILQERFDPVFVFLGNYKEYDELMKEFRKSFRIWHPSFIARNPDKFYRWIEQFQNAHLEALNEG